MVRLEEVLLAFAQDSVYVFQFLYGTIGRKITISNDLEFYGFQFLYGTIGRRQPSILRVILTTISIPVWYDWKSSQSTTKKVLFQGFTNI